MDLLLGPIAHEISIGKLAKEENAAFESKVGNCCCHQLIILKSRQNRAVWEPGPKEEIIAFASPK